MAASSIRIGLIGAGKNTRDRHIPGFQAIDGVEVVSVCNRSLESSQRVADQFGIPKSSRTGKTSLRTTILTPSASAPGRTCTVP